LRRALYLRIILLAYFLNSFSMKKRILAGAVALLLFVPAMLQAVSMNKAEDFAPGNSMVTADFQLTGKIKTLLEPFIQKALDESKSAGEETKDMQEKAEVIVDQFLAGERFFVSFSAPQSFLLAFPVSDAQWTTLTKGSEEHEYEGTKVYQDPTGGSFAKLGGLAVVSLDLESLHAAIDRSSGKKTDSLSANTSYTEFTKDYLDPRAMSLTLDIKAVSQLIEPLLIQAGQGDMFEGGFTEDETPPPNPIKPLLDLLNAIQFEGGSFGEVSNGYKFNFKVKGDAEELAKQELSFSAGGSFTPNLFKKFPDSKPVIYSESYNPKANYEQSQKFFKKLQENLGSSEEINIFDEIKNETGIDVAEIYSAFDKELSFGVQYDQNSILPYITLMGNVSSNKAVGTKLMNDLVKVLTDALKDNDVPEQTYSVTTEGGFTKVTFDLTKLEEDYNGPPFPEVVLTFGVSDDGLLIISNYPGIDKAEKRTGFAADSDFASHMNTETGPNTGIFYLNMRNVWGWFDAMATWGERTGGGENGPPLDFYQGYYSALEKIYGWRDVFISTKGTSSEALVTGTIVVDQAKHKTYEQLLKELRDSDRDGDGTSDYDERYVYHTSVEFGDSDNDGETDIEELEKGSDPEGEGRLWSDVDEGAYYTDETSFLYQRGAIKGYDDGTFKPGNNVNRAEFTTMVVKAFEQGTSNFLGVDVELKSTWVPFSDVDASAWYYGPVAKAYGAGFISGSTDAQTGELIFRPGETSPVRRRLPF